MKDNIVFRYSSRVENKRHVRKRQMRTPIAVLLLAGLIFIAGFFTVFSNSSQEAATNQELLSAENVEQNTQATQGYTLTGITFPSEGQAAIGTLQDGVLQTSSEQERQQPMASMTKVITALAILKKAPLQPGEQGDTFTLNQQDEQYYWEYAAVGGTITDVSAGLQFNQYDALVAMLLPSSNNMADTLIDNYFPSREDYFDFANEMLREYGLTKTVVADASGFSPDSISTPSEMITIGQKALQNPVIAEIVAKPKTTIGIAGEVPNYNVLIEEEGITGIKPGLTDEAGRCLLFSADTTDAKGNTVTVIGVVMGVDDFGVYVNGSLTMLEQAKQQLSLQNS